MPTLPTPTSAVPGKAVPTTVRARRVGNATAAAVGGTHTSSGIRSGRVSDNAGDGPCRGRVGSGAEPRRPGGRFHDPTIEATTDNPTPKTLHNKAKFREHVGERQRLRRAEVNLRRRPSASTTTEQRVLEAAPALRSTARPRDALPFSDTPNKASREQRAFTQGFGRRRGCLHRGLGERSHRGEHGHEHVKRTGQTVGETDPSC
jgi:hypothetical protein